MGSREGGPKGGAHPCQEGSLGPWSTGPCSPAPGCGRAAMQAAGWYSLALGLCVGFGGCIEAAQLCPVIGRDCRGSTGDGRGRAQLAVLRHRFPYIGIRPWEAEKPRTEA